MSARIITLIDQLTGKANRAPRQMIHPMSREDARFLELRKARKDGSHV